MKATRTAMLLGSMAWAVALSSFGFAGRTDQRVPLSGSILPVVAQSKAIGGVSPTDTIYITIGLQPRFPAELQAFCDSVSNPGSPDYRHFMTPAQVGEAFGASATDVSNVVSFLRTQGIKVNLVADNRMAILAQGTIAQAQAAFQTSFKQYIGPDPEGKTIAFRSNTGPVSLPSNIASAVVSVSGLESYTRPKPLSTTTLTPPLARGLYSNAPAYGNGFHGEGRTIAFSNWVGLRTSNLPSYISQYSLPYPAGGPGTNVQIITVNSGAAGGTENAEGDLDMQMELGMAPLANIRIYDNSTNDLVAVLTREVQDNAADVISESYGWQYNSSIMTSAHNQHLSMTAQGITYLAASGDSGTGIATYPYPDIEPEVLSVGGTIATVDSSTGARVSEVTWTSGGGGWSSASASFNVHPAWQVGNGVPTGNNHRLVPDIAEHSSGGSAGSDWFYYHNSLNANYDGTSFASPRTAGCIAILEQRLASAGFAPRLGRMQDMIYGENGRSDVWFDVTSGGNGTLPDGSSSTAHAGWDTSTGWGTPNFDGWYNVLALQQINPSGFSFFRGNQLSGNLSSLLNIDSDYLQARPGITLSGAEAPIQLVLNGTSPQSSVSTFVFDLVCHADTPGITQTIELFDWTANAYVSVDTRAATTTDSTVEVAPSNPNRFIQAGTNAVQAKVSFKVTGLTTHFPFSAAINQTIWKLIH